MLQAIYPTIDYYLDSLYQIFQPFGQPLYEQFEPVYKMIDYASNVTGINVPSLIYLTYFVLSIPFAMLHRKLPTGSARHLYSMTIGFIYCFFAFRWGALHSVITALIGYFIMVFFPYQIQHKMTFVIIFAYLTICQLYRMYVDYLGWTLDFTTLQMLHTLKIISCSFNYTDGQRMMRGEKLNTQNHERLAIQEIPSLLEYFGYLYFYPGVICAPVYDIKHYLEWSKTENPPTSLKAVLTRVMWALLNVLLFLLIPKFFFVGRETLISPFIDNLTMWQMFAYISITNLWRRPVYYTAWYFGEAGFIAAGFGNSGKNPTTGEIEWKNIYQADFYQVELACNLRDAVNHWNISVSKWLRHYVYERIGKPEDYVRIKGKKKSKSLNMVASFALSAFWHGLYPGYYSTFLLLSSVGIFTKIQHKKIRPRLFAEEKDPENPRWGIKLGVYKTICWILTHACLNYCTVGFHVLSVRDTHRWYSKMYYCGHVIILLFGIVVQLIPPVKEKKKE